MKWNWHGGVVICAVAIAATSAGGLALDPAGAWVRTRLSCFSAPAAVSAAGSRRDRCAHPLAAAHPVVASGVLVPEGELVHLSGGTAFQGARIEKVFVNEGDFIAAGQPIARSDRYATDCAAWRLAESQVAVAEAKVQQVLAGAKSNELQAQQAVIASADSELATARKEWQRYSFLFKEGAVTASQADQKRLDMDVAQQKVEQAQAALKALSETRPADLALAQAELQQTRAACDQAQRQLQNDTVLAPISGRVLQLNARKGEQMNTDGIATIGATSRMYADLEVLDADVPFVHAGQHVKLSSSGLTMPLNGTVADVSAIVQRRVLLDEDPAQDVDARVIKVRVKLDPQDSKRAAALSNLRVTGRIGENA